MKVTGSRAILSLLVVAGAVAQTACVDEDVVYEDRGLYTPISAEAGDFLGYADPSADDPRTVCGACHSDYEAQWEETPHAMAWEGMQLSDQVEELCEACHSVNSLGNIVPESGGPVGGHASVEDADGRYHDVQCESCHGPGLPHATNPTATNAPPAPIQVGSDLEAGCGECHSGFHHPLVEEWESSPHANVFEEAAQEEFCSTCHSGEGALLVRMGVTADYVEKDDLLGSDEAYAQITCAVCHDPHSNEFEGQLRFPTVVDDAEDHICAQCHDFRSQPSEEIPSGSPLAQILLLRPHTPETGLLGGTAGWYPPASGVLPGSIEGPHGADTNPRLCSSCHVVMDTVFDPESGTEFVAAGHGFRAAPCVGPNGLPTGQTGCPFTTRARSFKGCLGGECHASEEDALQTLETATTRINRLVARLSAALDNIDPNGGAPGGEIDPTDVIVTPAEGALFNLSLAVHPSFMVPGGSLRNPLSALAATVTHNPTLIETLLQVSIEAVRSEYGADVVPPIQPLGSRLPDHQ